MMQSSLQRLHDDGSSQPDCFLFFKMVSLNDIVLTVIPVKYIARNACEYMPLMPLFEDKGICGLDAEACSYCKVIREEYHCFKTTKTRLPDLSFG